MENEKIKINPEIFIEFARIKNKRIQGLVQKKIDDLLDSDLTKLLYDRKIKEVESVENYYYTKVSLFAPYLHILFQIKDNKLVLEGIINLKEPMRVRYAA
ncbi:MAG: hypothetical protein FWC53_00810 [Firmicutes bacterium]|nr:hypothetical protein [Bacillota bacterium]